MNIEILDKINTDNIDNKTFKKMIFLFNALENGWKISKINDKYIFKKKHNNEEQVFLDSYLCNFIKDNFDLTNIKIN